MEYQTASHPNTGGRHNVLDEYQELAMEERLSIMVRDSLPFAVCLLNLTGDINISQAIRTAAVLGAEKVLVAGRRKFDARGMVGVQNYIPIERLEARSGADNDVLDEEKILGILVERGMQPIGVETGGLPLSNETWSEILAPGATPCLIFGNEGEGIPVGLRAKMPIVSIPQRGVIRSLNVSAAASIVIWHMATFLSGKRNG